MRTQPRVNEAATEKQAPCKTNIIKKKKNQSLNEMVSHEKESAKQKGKLELLITEYLK